MTVVERTSSDERDGDDIVLRLDVEKDIVDVVLEPCILDVCLNRSAARTLLAYLREALEE